MVNSVIELQELRIGNLLEHKGELVTVTMLSMDIDDEYEEIIGFVRYGTCSDERAGWNRALALDLKRIPITPEWLERCGFGDGVLYLNQIMTSIRGANKDTEVRYCDANGNSVSRYYQYLHQLQNLYYILTGEELSIKI